MKKNIFKSKAFPAAALTAASIGILAACFLPGREEKPGFQPEGPVPGPIAQEWQETPSPATPAPPPAPPVPTGSPAAAQEQPRQISRKATHR